MSLVQIENFKSLFQKFKPTDEGEWERREDIEALHDEVQQGTSALKQIRGEGAYGEHGGGSLADVRQELDELLFALPQLEHRWDKMASFLVKGALKEVGKTIHELKGKVDGAPFIPVEGAEPLDKDDVESLRNMIRLDIKKLDEIYTDAKDALENRKPKETGELTGKSKGELLEGWNGITERYEYKHPDEWDRLADRDKLNLDILFDEDYEKNRKTQMTKLDSKVHVQKDDGEAANRLKIEREATALMRGGLTDNVNEREGKALEDVKNNSDFAAKLVSVLEENPDLLDTDGLLSRIMGGISGQGQFDDENNKWDDEKADLVKRKQLQDEQNEKNRQKAGTVIKSITDAAKHLKEGGGEGDDANKILQFISCFVDGLTEVTEGKKKPAAQLDKIWPLFRDAFDLEDDDKGNLLRRVQGYKEIAGGVSDTLSGKGTRKDDTRGGFMPTDTDYKIEDEDALIKGDISGSMHSCTLAQELSESLIGGKGIKQRGESVLVTDKEQLDARALDALSLTAGGKVKGKEIDVVLHTAYEMINGMRAISGAPKVSQSQATTIMSAMFKGGTFTNAMESLFPKEKLPWMNVPKNN